MMFKARRMHGLEALLRANLIEVNRTPRANLTMRDVAQVLAANPARPSHALHALCCTHSLAH